MAPGNAVGTLASIAARNVQTVIPAKAGSQTVSTPPAFHALDSRLRGNDDRGWRVAHDEAARDFGNCGKMHAFDREPEQTEYAAIAHLVDSGERRRAF